MGYATTLYAVDLDALRAAVGSNDTALVDQARAVARDTAGGVDPTRGPRIKVTRDSQIILNGRPISRDEMQAAVRDPRWAGMNLYLYQERGRKSGAWSEGGSFMRALQAALAGTHIAGVLTCHTEDELVAGWDGDDDLSGEQAAVELVAGAFTRPDGSYGYGLELLCRVLGTRLGVMEGKGRLKVLKLDSPLADPRLPVPMPAGDEFPGVSFLTAEEVRQELDRLGALNLSFPKSAAIERDRKALVQHLRSAAQVGRSVVAFYY